MPQGSSSQGLSITIDGPAGVGKSTVAKLLSSRLGYLYLDTGALYRALAWKILQLGIDPVDQRLVSAALENVKVKMTCTEGKTHVFVNEEEVGAEIRTTEIGSAASIISAYPEVRAWLLPIQREVAQGGGMVAEGRDLGTKVFPEADVKFFLEADIEVRAGRRHREMMATGRASLLEETKLDLQGRDQRDRSRSQAPLSIAPGAHVIDTSSLEVEGVVQRMLAEIEQKL